MTPGGGTGSNGEYVFGPVAVANADTAVILTIDRTVVGGLNALTSAVQADLIIYQSNDGGATFRFCASGHVDGGVYTYNDPNTGAVTTFTQSIINVQFWPGTNRQVRAGVSVVGGNLSVAGSLTVQ